MVSNDPDFETKAADIIGLYVNPPQHAAVFSVDEKTAIQALDRLDPVLPLSPGRAERHGFEYYRHGTLSLYAALNTRSWRSPRHDRPAPHQPSSSWPFCPIWSSASLAGRRSTSFVDNLSAHKTKRVEEFLAAHPNVHLHYTPTYSSWLNQVENWFSKIERDVIARGVFTSVNNLRHKAHALRRVLREIAAAHDATPRRWLRFLTRRRSVFAIPKASRPEHAAENAVAAELKLSDEEIGPGRDPPGRAAPLGEDQEPGVQPGARSSRALRASLTAAPGAGGAGEFGRACTSRPRSRGPWCSTRGESVGGDRRRADVAAGAVGALREVGRRRPFARHVLRPVGCYLHGRCLTMESNGTLSPISRRS